MKDMELFSDFFVIFVYFVVNFSPCFFMVSSYDMLSSIGESVLSLRDVIFCEIQDEKGQVLFEKGIKNKPYSCEYTAIIQTEKININDVVAEEGLILGKQEKQFEKIGRIRLVLTLDNIMDRLRGAILCEFLTFDISRG